MTVQWELDAIREYKRKTRKSARIFAKSQKLHVNGVHHNVRFFAPYPFVTKSARTKFLTDVDSNKYVDYWMGHWSLILGHAPASLRRAARIQLGMDWMHGTVNEATMHLSEAVQKAVPVAEKIRYTSTGTEAAMYAVRLARSYTGKKVVAKADGGWHGYTTDLLKTVNWPFDESESSGLRGEENILSIPYNDLEGSLEVLNSVKGDLACCIIEPVLGGGGCIPARPDYLRGIGEFLQSNGSMLVLDEIVTGFRFSYGCMYQEMGLDPDIVTLGKIIGGGFPIGAVCGRSDIMDMADTTRHPKRERSYIGGGTFSANPLSMSAGRAVLDELKKGRGWIYPKISALGDRARDALAKTFDGRVHVTGTGSLFLTHFLKDDVCEVQSASDAAACDTGLLERYHFELLARDGIFFLPAKLGAISGAHSAADVKNLKMASERFAASLPRPHV